MIDIYRKAKRQNILFIVFFIVLGATLLILYFGYFKKEKTTFPEISPEFPAFRKKEIKINWDILENPIFGKLEEFPQIEKLKPENIGKENPFSPK